MTTIPAEFKEPVKAKAVEFNPTVYECVKCGTGIYSAYPGQFVTCKCGAISVDQTQHYTRLLGNKEDFKSFIL
jgi:uncharacterized protein (DUF2225 family)